MTIRNFTPHEIVVYNHKNNIIATFPSEGEARCEVKREEIGSVIAEPSFTVIPVYKSTFGAVEGLPEEDFPTYYVVSRLVAEALKDERSDLLIPDDTVRNEKKQIIGCRAFARI